MEIQFPRVQTIEDAALTRAYLNLFSSSTHQMQENIDPLTNHYQNATLFKRFTLGLCPNNVQIRTTRTTRRENMFQPYKSFGA